MGHRRETRMTLLGRALRATRQNRGAVGDSPIMRQEHEGNAVLSKPAKVTNSLPFRANRFATKAPTFPALKLMALH